MQYNVNSVQLLVYVRLIRDYKPRWCNAPLVLRMQWLICAKFGADLINIAKVTSRKTKWPATGLYVS